MSEREAQVTIFFFINKTKVLKKLLVLRTKGEIIKFLSKRGSRDSYPSYYKNKNKRKPTSSITSKGGAGCSTLYIKNFW